MIAWRSWKIYSFDESRSRRKCAILIWFIIATLCNLSADAQSISSNNNDDYGIKNVHYLEPGSIHQFNPVYKHLGFKESILGIYCYRGESKTPRLLRFFESIELLLEIADDDYTQFEGESPKEVLKHYNEQRSLFRLNLFSSKRTKLQLSPFVKQVCVGIEAAQGYRVKLQQLRIDFWRVVQFTVALLLFLYAGLLSHNSMFFYVFGILLGIFSSFMLLVYITSKLVPRRPFMYGVLIGGWTLGIYLLQMLWENIQVIVVTYRTYVFWYVVVTGMVSFLICYRIGPPKNKRSKNIIKWGLQFLALVIIYLSSYFEEATVAIIVVLGISKYMPKSFLQRIRAAYLRHFPPKRRLLTNEEYYEQGVRETTKALEELRTYASSPECKQWKMMSKLRDPLRFAAFVEGASHLRDDEILRFEGSQTDQEYDSEDDTDDGGDENESNNITLDQNVTDDSNDEIDAYEKRRNLGHHQKVRIYALGRENISTNRHEFSISEDDEFENRDANRSYRNAHLTHAMPTSPIGSRLRRSVSNNPSSNRSGILETTRAMTVAPAIASSPHADSNYRGGQTFDADTNNSPHNLQRRSFGRSSIHKKR